MQCTYSQQLFIQRLDKKYCCHMTMVSSRAASFVNMNKDYQMSQCSQRSQYSVSLLQCVGRWISNGQCERRKTMFTKLERSSWIKIELARGRSTQECFQHLVVQNAIILHDSARSHTAAALTDLLNNQQGHILEHPPYSSDMSPCDYDLFAEVKELLQGTRYNTRDELTVLYGGQYATSKKMDKLMVYDPFQT